MTTMTAGIDTTRNRLGAVVDVLCDYPDQWAMLAAQPQLVPTAVEELMHHSPAFFMLPWGQLRLPR